MDGKYSWKRTEDIEIDMADLLLRLCGQWKRIVICALVSAVVLGGYGWLKERKNLDAARSETSQEAELTEAEEQAVSDAVRLENEIRGLEVYLDNSMLMQLDPYHKTRYIMLYSIDRAERQELPRIAESYLNFLLNGSAADALRKTGSSWKMDKSYLAEVITAYQKTYSSPYQIVVDSQSDSSQMAETLFYVDITGSSAKEAEKMALDLQGVLEEYSAKVMERAGAHRLTLVSTASSITVDTGLQSQQKERKALLSSNQTNLRGIIDNFSEKQLKAYQETVGVEIKDVSEKLEQDLAQEDTGLGMKYVFLGLMGGILLYCCIFACVYMFCGTVKSMDEMKRCYTFPVYGIMLAKGQKKKSGRDMSEMYKDASRDMEENVFNRIRIACHRQGIAKLYAASDFPLGTVEKDCLEKMTERFKGCGIDMEVKENICADTVAWDGLVENGNVLMVCRIGTTTHRMIDDVMCFYQENGINVAGAAVFLHNA